MSGSDTLRDDVVLGALQDRVLRAMLVPCETCDHVPTFDETAKELGVNDPRVEKRLVGRGLLHDGCLTDAGRAAATEIEARRVRDRWDRVVRWYARLRVLGEEHGPGDGAKAALAVTDYALAFLYECLAFSDWLRRASRAPLKLVPQAKSEELFKRLEFQICHDLGVEGKHMRVSVPKIDSYPSVVEVPAPGGNLELLVFAGGDMRDLRALATACYAQLVEFIEAAALARSAEVEAGAPQGPSTPSNITVPELSSDWVSSKP